MDTETIALEAQKDFKHFSPQTQSLRESHLKLFRQHEFVVADAEFYKFTNVSAFFNQQPITENGRQEFSSEAYLDVPTIFVVDGKVQPSKLKLKGVTITTLPDDYKLPAMRANALTHLHRGIYSDRILVTLDKNTILEKPLRILYVSSESILMAPTLVVNAGLHSQATIIEEHLALNLTAILLTESYFELSPGAQLEHIQLGDGPQTLQHGATYAKVAADATFKSFIFHLSGKLNRRNLELKLGAAGARGESYNLYLTHEKEHSDISTVIEHLSADSSSTQLAKGILDGESKGIFTGKIHIFPQAQRVVSGQLNKNLLLSKKAQAHSQPQLEIFADDVKCSHGSTTGQLSNEELFYFQSRGIPENRARNILAHGFGMEVVLKISNPEACRMVSQLINARLTQKFKLGDSL